MELCKYLYYNETNEEVQLIAIPTLVHIINNGINKKYSPENLCKELHKFLYIKDEAVLCKTVASHFSNNILKDKGCGIN